MPNALSVASFNIHAGVDGWGRPFDVVAACKRLDADILILEENLRVDVVSSTAEAVGEALGYTVHGLPFTTVEMLDPFPPTADEPRWGPPGLRPSLRAIRYPDRGSPPWRRTTKDEQERPSRTVTLGLALLAHVEHTMTTVALPKLTADPSHRSFGYLDVPLDDGIIRVAGAHFGHLSHLSLRQMRSTHRVLRGGPPTVLGGDMNCWGPPLVRFLPGMTRAVHGPTWPAWRPRHQIDHLLYSDGIEIAEGEVLPPLGSDHLAVRCVARLSGAPGTSRSSVSGAIP